MPDIDSIKPPPATPPRDSSQHSALNMAAAPDSRPLKSPRSEGTFPNGADLPPHSSADNVRVAIRVRPLHDRERAAASDTRYSWSITSTAITQTLSGRQVATNSFAFDNVFKPPSDNAAVYDALAAPVVTSAVEGINGVIFAYGQTAAGKTHTMLGNDQDRGVTPRSIAAVFQKVAANPNRQFLLRATYIEIYNEVIRDLLVPANDNLKIHEDAINKRVVVDAKEEVITSLEQVMQIIAAGEQVRAVGETNMNDRSSRSHTIFSIKIESREVTAADARARRQTQAVQSGQPIPESDDENEYDDDATNEGVAIRSSTLSLVDLAGSERASFTKAQGMRLVEGGHINKSLLTLGNVINKLSSTESRSLAHIPYRDSKLTRLLQPALGGNARTAILCAVTPAFLHMDETLSTLKFASRAKKVTNSAKTNELLDDRAKLRRAEKLIAKLKGQLQVAQKGSTEPSQGFSSASLLTREATSQPSNSPHRVKKFQKKFDIIMDAIKQKETHSTALATPPRKRRKISSISALHLMCEEVSNQTSTKNRKSSLSSTRSSGGASEDVLEASDVADLASMRREVFRAERDKRKALKEIKYEREEMANEISVLVATIDEANRQREIAERESDDAHSSLAMATAKSLLDEVVSEAMATSSLQSNLRETKKEVTQLTVYRSENAELKGSMAALRKENAHLVRREKRGVGPVIKECKQAQTKLADAEQKLRGARQTSTSLTIEKARLERELRSRESNLKAISQRLEMLKKKKENRVAGRVEKEVSQVRKVADAEINELKTKAAQAHGEATVASEAAAAAQKRVEEISEKLVESEKTLMEARSEIESLTKAVTGMKVKLSEAQQEMSSSKEEALGAKKRAEKSDAAAAESDAKCKVATDAREVAEKKASEATEQAKIATEKSVKDEELRKKSEKEAEDAQAAAASSFADASKWEARAGNEKSRREELESSHEIEKNSLEEKLSKLEEESDELHKEVDSFQIDLENVRCQHNELDTLNKKLAAQIATLEAEAKKQQSEHKEAHERSQKEISRLSSEISTATEEIESKRVELANLKTEYKQTEDRIKAEMTRRTNDAESVRMDLEGRVKQTEEARFKAESNCKILGTRIEELEAKLGDSRSRLHDDQNKNVELSTKLRISETNEAEMKKMVNGMRDRISQMEVEDERKRRQETERLVKVDAELLQSKTRVSELEREAGDGMKRRRELEGEIGPLRKQVKEREEEAEREKRMYAKNRQNLENEVELRLEKMKVEMARLEKGMHKARQEKEAAVSKLGIELDAAEERAARADSVDEDRAKEMRRLQDELCLLLEEDVTRKRELENVNRALQSREAQLAQIERKMREMKRGEGQLGAVQGRLTRRTAMVKELTRRVEILDELVRERNLGSKNEELVRRVAEAEGKCSGLAHECGELRGKIEGMEKEEEKLQTIVTGLRKKIRESGAERLERSKAWKEDMLQKVKKGSFGTVARKHRMETGDPDKENRVNQQV